ncbi:MAG: transcription elongation factor GreA [Anaerolineales bacterium]
MSHPNYYLTADGAERLRKELAELKSVKRVELSRRLRIAIQQGDLSENADYSKAKEDQAFLEGRIQELEALLSQAQIISEGASPNGVIGLGSVVLIREQGREPVKYFLVGAQEADPRNGRISHESPIGRVLLGRKAGDTVKAATPAGELSFEIIEVE